MTGPRAAVSALFKGPEEFDLTDGGIGKPLFFLSIPIVVMNLFQVAYNLADTFWLGQYDTSALAAISFAFPLVFLLISLALGVSVTGSVLVAQYTGAGRTRQATYAASQTVGYAAFASVVLGAVGFVFVDDVLALMGADPSYAPLVARYMRVYAVGLVFVFGFAVFVALLRGYGDTITPMWIMAGSVVLNIVLDPILIFGFDANPLFAWVGLSGLEARLFEVTGYAGSGIEGAAIATVGSRALAFAVGLAIMFAGTRGVTVSLREMVPDPAFGRTIIDVGVPATVEGTTRAVSITVLLVVVAGFPEVVVSAFGIGTRLFSVVFLPALAVSQGIETMTGQNVGAEKPDRVAATNHFGAKALFAVLTAMGLLTLVAARPVAAVFTTDPAVVDEAASFLRISALSFGFIGISRAYTGGFRGTGKTLVAAAIALLTLGVVRIPIAWVAAGAIGPLGIWIAFPISNLVGAVVSYLWFQRGTWREADLTGRGGDVLEAEVGAADD